MLTGLLRPLMYQPMEEFYRINRLPPYVFAEVNKLKAKFRAEGRDIIDLGMGNPDSPTPAHIVEKMRQTALDETAHGYSVSRGIHGLRKGFYAIVDNAPDIDEPDGVTL